MAGFSIFKDKPKDIELPNESGRVDKRLPKSSPLETLKSSFDTFKRMTTSKEPIEGLKAAGKK